MGPSFILFCCRFCGGEENNALGSFFTFGMVLLSHESEDGLGIFICLLLAWSTRIFAIVSQLFGTTQVTYGVTVYRKQNKKPLICIMYN